jgi:hypothetical protein
MIETVPTLTVDLNDVDDLRHAQNVIAARIAELGTPGDPSTQEGDRELEEAEAEAFAQTLWSRIQNTENTRALVRCFVEFDGPFSLAEVAEKLDQQPEDIRHRVFRFGRTEGKLVEQFGQPLLVKVGPYSGHYTYEIAPKIRAAVREIIRSEGR